MITRILRLKREKEKGGERRGKKYKELYINYIYICIIILNLVNQIILQNLHVLMNLIKGILW